MTGVQTCALPIYTNVNPPSEIAIDSTIIIPPIALTPAQRREEFQSKLRLKWLSNSNTQNKRTIDDTDASEAVDDNPSKLAKTTSEINENINFVAIQQPDPPPQRK